METAAFLPAAEYASSWSRFEVLPVPRHKTARSIMSDSPEFRLSRAQELALHRRLVEGDPVATSDLAVEYLDALIRWLTQHNRKIHPHLCDEAAERAILSLGKNPGSYDPGRGRLETYLRMSAKGDLQNLLRQETSWLGHRRSLKNVEESPDGRKYMGRDDDPALPLQIEEEMGIANNQLLPLVRQGLTEGELRVFDLMLGGERKTAVFARAYEISHLPKKDQEKKIKQAKDKLKKRLERSRADHGESS